MSDFAPNLEKLFDLLAEVSGRTVAAEVLAIPADEMFPAPVSEKALEGLEAAVRAIGKELAGGEGEIDAEALEAAVASYYEVYGTPYCPPVLEALAKVAGSSKA